MDQLPVLSCFRIAVTVVDAARKARHRPTRGFKTVIYTWRVQTTRPVVKESAGERGGHFRIVVFIQVA